LSRPPTLGCTRTFSKAFRMAGLRLGYLLADPAVVDGVRLVRLPYHLSALTQAVGLRALRHKGALMSPVGAPPAAPTPSPSSPRSPRGPCGAACWSGGSWSATCPATRPWSGSYGSPSARR